MSHITPLPAPPSGVLQAAAITVLSVMQSHTPPLRYLQKAISFYQTTDAFPLVSPPPDTALRAAGSVGPFHSHHASCATTFSFKYVCLIFGFRNPLAQRST